MNETGRYTQGLDYFHKALDELDKKGVTGEERVEYIHLYVAIGNSYLNIKESDRALLYFEKAIEEIQWLPEDGELDVCNAITMLTVYTNKKEIKRKNIFQLFNLIYWLSVVKKLKDAGGRCFFKVFIFHLPPRLSLL